MIIIIRIITIIMILILPRRRRSIRRRRGRPALLPPRPGVLGRVGARTPPPLRGMPAGAPLPGDIHATPRRQRRLRVLAPPGLLHQPPGRGRSGCRDFVRQRPERELATEHVALVASSRGGPGRPRHGQMGNCPVRKVQAVEGLSGRPPRPLCRSTSLGRTRPPTTLPPSLHAASLHPHL